MPEIPELRERVLHWRQMILQATDPKAIEVMRSIIFSLETDIRRQEDEPTAGKSDI